MYFTNSYKFLFLIYETSYNELSIFYLFYYRSKLSDDFFTLSIDAISDELFLNRRTITRSIKSLLENNLIFRFKNNHKVGGDYYLVNPNFDSIISLIKECDCKNKKIPSSIIRKSKKLLKEGAEGVRKRPDYHDTKDIGEVEVGDNIEDDISKPTKQRKIPIKKRSKTVLIEELREFFYDTAKKNGISIIKSKIKSSIKKEESLIKDLIEKDSPFYNDKEKLLKAIDDYFKLPEKSFSLTAFHGWGASKVLNAGNNPKSKIEVIARTEDIWRDYNGGKDITYKTK